MPHSPSPSKAAPYPAMAPATPVVVPPHNLKWSSAMQQLSLNSSKLMEEMHQTARQAVTVTMRAVPQLRKLTHAAGNARDRMGIHARLLMRRTALAGLMAATGQLLEDLDTFFSMVDGTMARTHGRRIESLVKDLEGAQAGFSLASSELDQACRFMLVREPRVVVDPIDADARVAEEGQRDTKQVDGVARSVIAAQASLASVWSTMLALQAADITVDEPAWLLMAQLDLNGASAVLDCLQLDGSGSKSGAAGGPVQNSASSPGPCRVPSGVRDTSTPWWKSKSSTSKKASPAGARALSPQKAQPGQASVGCFANGQGANGQVANGHSGAISTIEVRRLKSGDVYRGTVVNGRKVGAGIFEFACRDVYVGEFSDDAIHGHGVYNFFATEGTYSGQWVNGKYEGYGVEFFQNDSFHGGYRNGARHGWGAATFENGDAYEGQWANGLRHGLGMHLSADGSTYVGNFLNGKRHGHGSFTAAAGGHYQGQYQLDVPHGHGTYLLASGHTYQGRWEAGQKEGWFQFKLPTGEQWAGRMAKGRPQWVEAVSKSDRLETISAEGETTGRGEALALALAEGAKARTAASTAAAIVKDQWQPSSPAQAALQEALSEADAAAQTADTVRDTTKAAVAAAEAAAAAAEAAAQAAINTTA